MAGHISTTDCRVGDAHSAATFPRIKDLFIYEEQEEQQIALKMFVLLYNMQARMVGINQIQNSSMRHLNRNANKDVWF